MTSIDRRDFLKAGTGAMTAFAITVEGAGLFAQFAADTPPLPAAVIGTGRQGRVIMGELDKFPFVKMAALCDVRESRLKSACRRAPDARTYTDYRALLDGEKDLKAVFIATPTHAHADIAVACIEAGKHVYCESPMAAAIDDCSRIARAAMAAPAVFHAGLQYRANPIYNLARTFFVSGAVRDLVSLRARFRSKTSWRTPADPAQDREVNWRLYKDISIGLAGEEGTHQLDIMAWFLNRMPVAVSGCGGLRSYNDGRDVPDTIHCTVTWPGDLLMTYEATLANSFGGRCEQFMGTMGAIQLIGDFGWLFKEADAPTQGWEVYAIRESFHKEEGITLIADATKLAKQGKLREGAGLPHPAMYYGIAEFLDSVTAGKPSTCPAPLGLRAAVLGIKANEAVMSGRQIAFEEDWFKIG